MVSVSTNSIKRQQMATQARTQIQELEVITEQSLALPEMAGLGRRLKLIKTNNHY
jgi:hypothetical protein